MSNLSPRVRARARSPRTRRTFIVAATSLAEPAPDKEVKATDGREAEKIASDQFGSEGVGILSATASEKAGG